MPGTLVAVAGRDGKEVARDGLVPYAADPATGWSNHYRKDRTALLPAVSEPLAWSSAVAVSYWDGSRFVPVRAQHITWATGPDRPTRVGKTGGGHFPRIAAPPAWRGTAWVGSMG